MVKKRLRKDDRPGFRRHYVREWRRYNGLTQEQLAERLDTTASAISQLENGKQGYTQPMLEALALALDTDEASLLSRDPTDPEGIWSVWQQIPAAERPRAIAVLRACFIAQMGN